MVGKSMLKGHRDLVIAVVAIPFALWLFVIAPMEAPGLYDDGIQPWLFPRMILLFTMLLCILLAINSLKEHHGQDKSTDEGAASGGGESQSKRAALLNAVVPPSLVLIYVIGTIWIGYIYATAVVASLYMLFLGASLLMTLLITIGLTAVLYFVFGDLLNIPLPLGLLFQ